jgi:hypothetical protein
MKRSGTSKQEYFCENCGSPVSARARRCPHCGKEFLAVRCPKCSFAGKADLFESGCPVCGYQSVLQEAGTGVSVSELSSLDGKADAYDGTDPRSGGKSGAKQTGDVLQHGTSGLQPEKETVNREGKGVSGNSVHGYTDGTIRITRSRRWLYWLISVFLVGAIAALIILYIRL